MNRDSKPLTILIADDDLEDQMLVKAAWSRSQLPIDLHFVDDGEQLLDYLHRRGVYVNPVTSPRPGIVLLDLNMPRMDGFEALIEIKNDPELRSIPVVVLTSSKAEEDIAETYSLGVCGFVTKPVTFDGLVETIKGLGQYWIDIVQLPP